MLVVFGAPAARARSTPLGSAVALLALLAAASCGASASPTHAAEAPPGNRLELGFEERVRSENWDNVADFSAKSDDARHQWRFRTRLWAKCDLGSKAGLMLGLNNESRRVTHPVTDFLPDETIFETLYLDYRFADDVHVKVGRQNITKGDGLLVFDATPLDGTRTQYFNAVDLSYAAGRTRFDLYAISDPHRDRYLPRFDDKQKPLIESHERALALYCTDGRLAKTTLDAYYVFKTETGDTRPLSNVARLPDRALHTLGGRAVWQPGRGWEAKAELAGQLGVQQPAADILAWGGTASVKRTLEHAAWKPAFLLGWIGLSGDDPSTVAYEGWDPLFARWPKWSEMLVYTLGAEKGPAYWTNLSLGQAEVQVAPASLVTIRASYCRLGAFHGFPGRTSMFAAGTHRGDYLRLRAEFKANDSWQGHVVGEHLKPGDFYAGRDPGWFFRVEMIYSFRKTFRP